MAHSSPSPADSSSWSEPLAITASAVSQWGKFTLPTEGELALLERVITAVVDHIETYFIVSDPLSDAQEQAVLMQSARLWRRRESLDGIAAVNDFGPLRVSSIDPDVRTLLTPVWGFA